MEEKRRADELAKGTRCQFKGKEPSGGAAKVPPEKAVTLADQGVDKHLADRARAASPERSRTLATTKRWPVLLVLRAGALCTTPQRSTCTVIAARSGQRRITSLARGAGRFFVLVLHCAGARF